MAKTKLEKLEEQAKQINERLKQERAKENAKQRKLETRKKILTGNACMQAVKADKSNWTIVKKWLDTYTTKANDRELLGLDKETVQPVSDKSDNDKSNLF